MFPLESDQRADLRHFVPALCTRDLRYASGSTRRARPHRTDGVTALMASLTRASAGDEGVSVTLSGPLSMDRL